MGFAIRQPTLCLFTPLAILPPCPLFCSQATAHLLRSHPKPRLPLRTTRSGSLSPCNWTAVVRNSMTWSAWNLSRNTTCQACCASRISLPASKTGSAKKLMANRKPPRGIGNVAWVLGHARRGLKCWIRTRRRGSPAGCRVLLSYASSGQAARIRRWT